MCLGLEFEFMELLYECLLELVYMDKRIYDIELLVNLSGQE